MKNAALINSIVGLGKCSLTISIPVFSVAGITPSIIPTAVLSTHTGGFGTPYRADTGDCVEGFSRHWEDIDIAFDAVSTGYLTSREQAEAAVRFIENQRKRAEAVGRRITVLADPTMGDHGRYYAGMAEGMADSYKKVCAAADIVVPNMTEACILLGIPYTEGPYTEDYLRYVAKELCTLGCKIAVITGIGTKRGELGAAVYDSESNRFTLSLSGQCERNYHGTGDLFASVLLAAVVSGCSAVRATDIAVRFIRDCIAGTMEDDTDERLGVNFEVRLPLLMDMLRQSDK
ncbi:MAG: pyridoxamine kinase [Oscillospiraceae bacterium]|nr:pyridoxamine kinase [Oscillospiraceae bacterium]